MTLSRASTSLTLSGTWTSLLRRRAGHLLCLLVASLFVLLTDLYKASEPTVNTLKPRLVLNEFFLKQTNQFLLLCLLLLYFLDLLLQLFNGYNSIGLLLASMTEGR
jgi:hypothetical protein